jgi:hypothetical protein
MDGIERARSWSITLFFGATATVRTAARAGNRSRPLQR